jgi:hypothetical protein
MFKKQSDIYSVNNSVAFQEFIVFTLNFKHMYMHPTRVTTVTGNIFNILYINNTYVY